MENENGNGKIVLQYIVAMLKRADAQQLNLIYIFLRSYLKTPLDVLEKDVKAANRE